MSTSSQAGPALDHVATSRCRAPTSSDGAECVIQPGRDIVDAGRRHRRDRLERDAARGLEHHAAGRHARPPCACRRRPCCRAARRRRDRYPAPRASWSSVSTSISIFTRWPALARARSSTRADAAGDRDVVVLDQHRVVEAEAVVEAAAAAHGVFLERAQARRGLAGAADAGLRALVSLRRSRRWRWRCRRDGRAD